MLKRRNTERKTLIREILAGEFAGGPVLLEELRWAVFVREFAGDELAGRRMTVSYTKSFNRTLRVHLSEILTFSLGGIARLPVGLLARAAMHRVEDYDEVSRLRDPVDIRAHFSLSTDAVRASFC